MNVANQQEVCYKPPLTNVVEGTTKKTIIRNSTKNYQLNYSHSHRNRDSPSSPPSTSSELLLPFSILICKQEDKAAKEEEEEDNTTIVSHLTTPTMADDTTRRMTIPPPPSLPTYSSSSPRGSPSSISNRCVNRKTIIKDTAPALPRRSWTSSIGSSSLRHQQLLGLLRDDDDHYDDDDASSSSTLSSKSMTIHSINLELGTEPLSSLPFSKDTPPLPPPPPPPQDRSPRLSPRLIGSPKYKSCQSTLQKLSNQTTSLITTLPLAQSSSSSTLGDADDGHLGPLLRKPHHHPRSTTTTTTTTTSTGSSSTRRKKILPQQQRRRRYTTTTTISSSNHCRQSCGNYSSSMGSSLSTTSSWLVDY